MEEESKGEKEEEGKGEKEEEEEEITTTIQSSPAMQQSFTRGQGNCFFPVNKVEENRKEEEEKVENKQQEEEKDKS